MCNLKKGINSDEAGGRNFWLWPTFKNLSMISNTGTVVEHAKKMFPLSQCRITINSLRKMSVIWFNIHSGVEVIIG